MTYNADGFEWREISSEKFTAKATITNFDVPAGISTEKVLLATFFFLPQTTKSTFNIAYTYPGTLSTGATFTQEITLTGQEISSSESWVQGLFMGYTLGFEKNKITITTTNFPTWSSSGTEETVTGSAVITIPVAGSIPEWKPGNSTETVEGIESITT